MAERLCLVCKKVLTRDKRSKYCSYHCSGIAHGFQKGHIPWSKGIHPKHLQGKRHPMYGKKHTKEALAKMESNLFKKGMTPWNKGIEGYTTSLKGVKRSEEFCKKLSETRKRKIDEGTLTTQFVFNHSIRNTGKTRFKKGVVFSKEHIKKCLGRRKMSGLEQRVDKIIKKYNLPYRFVGNGKFFIERKNPDFVNVNGEKKAVEVYWDRHKEQFSKGGLDGWKKDRINVFGKYGWEVIFIEGSHLNEDKVINFLS